MTARTRSISPMVVLLAAACAPAQEPDPAQPRETFALEERESLGSDRLPCPVGRDAECAGDYVDLAASFLPEGFDLAACAAERTRELLAVQEGRPGFPPDQTPYDADGLADRVVEELDVEEWLAGLDGRPTVVTRVGVVDRPAYQERSFLIEDPLVGTFRVRMLAPHVEDTDGVPVPALIALPGHPSGGDQVDEFLDEQHGRVYAEAGYLVAVPAFRAYDTGLAEHQATTALLCAGLSTLAVRHYETLLVHKFLRAMQERGEVGRIGAIGHSGGSVAGNLLARYATGLDSWVSDLSSTYVNVAECEQAPDGFCVLDESHLGIHALQERINDFHAPRMPMPMHLEEYGYPDGPEAVLEHLESSLR